MQPISSRDEGRGQVKQAEPWSQVQVHYLLGLEDSGYEFVPNSGVALRLRHGLGGSNNNMPPHFGFLTQVTWLSEVHTLRGSFEPSLEREVDLRSVADHYIWQGGFFMGLSPQIYGVGGAISGLIGVDTLANHHIRGKNLPPELEEKETEISLSLGAEAALEFDLNRLYPGLEGSAAYQFAGVQGHFTSMSLLQGFTVGAGFKF
ncbi:MAG: hypothetical protein Q7S68_05305 [Deltaproteobacteria bacterium]|nr:hypothetical protein [Deltaproteobacteria bacterium]